MNPTDYKKFIEQALSSVREDFEKRKNTAGLKMLDGVETWWNEKGFLCEGQEEWLRKQLDGSWYVDCKSKQGAAQSIQQLPQSTKPVPSPHHSTEVYIDEMIKQRLSEQGKVVVDGEHLDTMIGAVDELGENLRLMRDGQ